MEVKNELKGYIAASGESMASIADKLGITRSAMTQKINNESLRYKDAVRIAELLGYRIKWERIDDK